MMGKVKSLYSEGNIYSEQSGCDECPNRDGNAEGGELNEFFAFCANGDIVHRMRITQLNLGKDTLYRTMVEVYVDKSNPRAFSRTIQYDTSKRCTCPSDGRHTTVEDAISCVMKRASSVFSSRLSKDR